jgi:hypothetical protein
MLFQLTEDKRWNGYSFPSPSREVNTGVEYKFPNASNASETEPYMESTTKGLGRYDQTEKDPIFDIGSYGLTALPEGLVGNYFRSVQVPDKTVGQPQSKTVIMSTLGGAAGRQDRKDKLEAAFIQHARKILSLDATVECTNINRNAIAFNKKRYFWVHKKEAKDLPWMLSFRQWTQEQQNAAVDCMEWNVIGLEIVRQPVIRPVWFSFSGLMSSRMASPPLATTIPFNTSLSASTSLMKLTERNAKLSRSFWNAAALSMRKSKS